MAEWCKIVSYIYIYIYIVVDVQVSGLLTVASSWYFNKNNNMPDAWNNSSVDLDDILLALEICI